MAVVGPVRAASEPRRLFVGSRLERLRAASSGAPETGDEGRRTMPSEQMTGAEMVIRALLDQGIDVVFGYPGGAVLPIYDAIFNQNQLRLRKHHLRQYRNDETPGFHGHRPRRQRSGAYRGLVQVAGRAGPDLFGLRAERIGRTQIAGAARAARRTRRGRDLRSANRGLTEEVGSAPA